jgi:DeoR family transcriptional regulator of aga operon
MLGSQVDALMIQIAREVTIVADSSKIGRRGLSVIAKTNAIHRLITDRGVDPRLIDEIEAQGITVQLV